MPYTNPWDDTIPPGTEQAKNIDNHLRQIRLDIHERMDTIVEDWLADPIVLKPIATVGGDDKFIFIGGSAFKSDEERMVLDSFLQIEVTTTPAIASIPIPAGSIIKQVSFMIDRGDRLTVQGFVYSLPFVTNPAAPSLIENTILYSGASDIVVLDTPEFAYTVPVDGSAIPYLMIRAVGGSGDYIIGGARVKYA